MIPVLTPEEMRRIDEAAPTPVEVLIERAGAAVAAAALRRLGGGYGRRVVVVAGKGNNGADGRAAADRLRRRGVHVSVVDPDVDIPACDLVIDAAYGTGFHGDYEAPDPNGAPVLAVDVPSGSVVADATVTFAALKPGLLFGDAAGIVEVADIGLDVSVARMHVVEDGDVVLPTRPREAHKWQTALLVVGGSPGMMGAPQLAARAAMRAGAGYVRLAVSGDLPGGGEAVAVPLPHRNWAALADRCRAVVVGPGLGRDDRVRQEANALLAAAPLPAVVDADGLNVLDLDVLRGREAPTVLTPHDGEYERLAGRPVGDDRVAAARELAESSRAVVLLKGSTTVVAAPDGEVLFSVTGGPHLATAGTGDVLSGVVGAFLAQGLDPLRAAAFAAHVHGAASARGLGRGLVAGDLPDLVAEWLSE
jgi:NAD(P)H-hydrate repair Nnr-like enzyme with NAD(P)H-hydrate dehydratase domain/NAD(P)H-hydrate repair Nnr-like enzyme with NAD(P)H-hydrate epimerase domain